MTLGRVIVFRPYKFRGIGRTTLCKLEKTWGYCQRTGCQEVGSFDCISFFGMLHSLGLHDYTYVTLDGHYSHKKAVEW